MHPVFILKSGSFMMNIIWISFMRRWDARLFGTIIDYISRVYCNINLDDSYISFLYDRWNSVPNVMTATSASTANLTSAAPPPETEERNTESPVSWTVERLIRTYRLREYDEMGINYAEDDRPTRILSFPKTRASLLGRQKRRKKPYIKLPSNGARLRPILEVWVYSE